MSIERQNELFPNNVEHRLKQKLQKQYADVAKTSSRDKSLDLKLDDDRKALNHQKYLLEGVMKEMVKKRHDLRSHHRGLVKNGTERWLKKRDTSTETAKIGTVRGAFFGNSRPVRRPVQIGEVIPIARN